MGVACLLPVNTWKKGYIREILAVRPLCTPDSPPHLTSPWSGGGIAVLFRRDEPYADLRNIVVASLLHRLGLLKLKTLSLKGIALDLSRGRR